MAKPDNEHDEVRELEDVCWLLKDVAGDFYGRASLSGPDRAAIVGATRDMRRIHERLVAVRDKRKRKDTSDEPEATAPAAEQQPTEQDAANVEGA